MGNTVTGDSKFRERAEHKEVYMHALASPCCHLWVCVTDSGPCILDFPVRIDCNLELHDKINTFSPLCVCVFFFVKVVCHNLQQSVY